MMLLTLVVLMLKIFQKLIGNKNIQANFLQVQAYDSVMCGYFCIGFIDFMLPGENLIDFTNRFSTNALMI